jgi:hypothetical protein
MVRGFDAGRIKMGRKRRAGWERVGESEMREKEKERDEMRRKCEMRFGRVWVCRAEDWLRFGGGGE